MTGNDRAARRADAVTHHDLCFGCGAANLFGLQAELERTADGVAGRFFVKQDHQGPAGHAHGGLIAAALDEAMALAAEPEGEPVLTRRLEVDLHAPVPVGTFLRVEAAVERREGDRVEARAAASADGAEPTVVAEGRAVRVRAPGPDDAGPVGGPEPREPTAPEPVRDRAIAFAREARERFAG